jgi:hypothetical protein
MKYPPKAYSRDERKSQVVGQFNIWHQKGDTKPRTMSRIARSLGMTPSSKFRDLLLEMADEKILIVDPPGNEGSHTVRHYSLVSTLITEKSLQRKITLRKRGAVVGQLEMFS